MTLSQPSDSVSCAAKNVPHSVAARCAGSGSGRTPRRWWRESLTRANIAGKRDARLLVAHRPGTQRRWNVQWIEVVQSTEDQIAIAPVELLVTDVPIERNGLEAIAAVAVEIVADDAAEFRARQCSASLSASPAAKPLGTLPQAHACVGRRSRTTPCRSPQRRSRATVVEREVPLDDVGPGSPRLKLRLPSSWFLPVLGVIALPWMPTSELLTSGSSCASWRTVRIAVPTNTEP